MYKIAKILITLHLLVDIIFSLHLKSVFHHTQLEIYYKYHQNSSNKPVNHQNFLKTPSTITHTHDITKLLLNTIDNYNLYQIDNYFSSQFDGYNLTDVNSKAQFPAYNPYSNISISNYAENSKTETTSNRNWQSMVEPHKNNNIRKVLIPVKTLVTKNG